jgi:hypothetical protein
LLVEEPQDVDRPLHRPHAGRFLSSHSKSPLVVRFASYAHKLSAVAVRLPDLPEIFPRPLARSPNPDLWSPDRVNN